MPYLMSAFALIAMAVGAALGTFRHRYYGVWSFFGILVAIAVTGVVGGILSGYVQTVTGGIADATAMTLIIRILLLATLSALLSYYCENLLPVTPDPKTRSDNILAGLLGFFNAFLIAATSIGYFRDYTGGKEYVESPINGFMLTVLPWSMVAVVLFLIGWASVRKVRAAIATLRGTTSDSSATSPIPTQSPANTPYQNSPYANNPVYTPAYPSTSTPSVAADAADVPAKPGFMERVRQFFARKPIEDPDGATSPNWQPSNDGYGMQSTSVSSGASQYGTVSGATPPYGINTGTIASASSYNSYTGSTADNSSQQSSFFGQTSSTSNPSQYGQSGSSYGSSPTYSQPSSGYGQQTSSYGQSSSGYGSSSTYEQPSSSYGQQPSSYGQPGSGYGSSSTYEQPSSGYGQQSSYTQPNSTTAGGSYGQQPPQYGQQPPQYGQPTVGGFGSTPAWQQQSGNGASYEDGDDSYHDGDNDDDDYSYNGPPSPPPFRG